MSADTRTVGYPVHRLVAFAERENQHGAIISTWRAACGASGSRGGHLPRNTAGQARRRELCTAGCWPGEGCHGAFPAPVDESEEGR